MEEPTSYSYYHYLALAVALLVFVRVRKRRGGDGVKLPPGPWRLPVIGSLHHLAGKPLVHRALADLARRMDAPLMYLRLGEVPVVVATSPGAAREVMRTHDVAFATRPLSPTVKIMMADGEGLVFAPYGDLWRQLRRIAILELLSARRVQSFRRVREEEGARLAAAVAAAPHGEAVNVSERIAVLIADSAVRAMIGDRFKKRDEFLEALAEGLKLVSGFSIGDLFPSSWLASFVTGAARRAQENHRKNFELMDCAIEQHQERRAAAAASGDVVEDDDLVDVLLRIQKGGGLDVPLTMGIIKAVILDLFSAGSETSATTVQWAMSELMKNPRVMKRAQAELRDNLQGKPKITEEDLGDLNYLKLIIKETLRLHLPAPLLLPRESRESCKIFGYDVPKGTTVLVNAWAIGRDPQYWDDPEEFKPERFEDSKIDYKGLDFEFLPFGAGRRMCPGIMFAQPNIELALATLLYHFDWSLPAGVEPSELDMTEEMGITVRRKNDLYLHAVVLIEHLVCTVMAPMVQDVAEYLSIFLALVVVQLLLLSVARRARGNGAGRPRLPPGPWRLPVIGSLHHLMGKPHVHRAMADLARRHGAPLMYLELGEVPFVVASSPDAAREILRAQDANFASRPWSPTLRVMMADGEGLAFARYGAHWRRLRKICVLELLGPRRVQSFRRVREEEVARLLAAVAVAAAGGASDDDAVVNVSERAAVLVTDTTVRAMIGDRFERRDEYLEGVAEVGKLLLGFSLGDLFPSSRLASLVSGTARRAAASHRKMFELMDCAIRQHQERKAAMDDADADEDILDVLLRIQKEEGHEAPLTMGDVKDTILDLFAAGTETSTATLQWAMSEVVRNPRITQKAQAELRNKLQGKPSVTEDDLVDLTYLKLVIKETLRLHPAAPMLIPRECGESCKVLGYDVPRGTNVLVNAWAIGRDPNHWDDAETFKPERYESSEFDFRGTNLEYIPFGSGRRMCPGPAFAHAIVELAIAALLYHFDWELPGGVAPGEVDMAEETGVVVRPKNDLYLRPVVRVPPGAAWRGKCGT
uniref:Cytochrome P450 n=1 Tax=Oryza punctata TaxID=4537 RepID=A0A0E0JWI3_ORYPU